MNEIIWKTKKVSLAQQLQEVIEMKHRHLPSSLRLVALFVLIAWTTSLVFCSAACLGGQCDSEKEAASHDHSDSHHHSDSDAHHHDNSAPGHPPGGCPSEQTACGTLKFTVLPSPLVSVSPPQLLVAVLVDLHSSVVLSYESPSPELFRQYERLDWVFTPEVYLGPAFRCHAPPSLA